MAIVQFNPEAPNLDVSIGAENPAVLKVEGRTLPGGVVVAPAEIDLTPFQGGPFRLYVQDDGTLVVALEGVHYWLVAEGFLPERRSETVTSGEGDEEVAEHVEIPLDLNEVEIVVYPWPTENEPEVD